ADHRPAAAAAEGPPAARVRPPARRDGTEALKVLVLTSSYPTPEEPVGGIFVQEYARTVAREAEVAVVHLQRGGARRMLVERQPDGDLPALRVRFPPGPGWFAWNLAAAHAAWRRLPFEPDVIYAHFVVAGVPAVVLGRLHRKPVVISENLRVFLPDHPD